MYGVRCGIISVLKTANIKEPSPQIREREGLNEFEHGDELLCKAFPDVFMFGRAYESKKPALDRSQARHLLMQFTTNAASCQPLLFQLFDQMKRQSAILGMHGKCVSDKEAFEEFAHEFSSEEFHEKMRDAVKDPAGESAKFVLRKIVPFLTTAGRKTVFGAVERNKCAGEILALGRKHGCASDFLTFGIDDVNHPKCNPICSVQSRQRQFSKQDLECFARCHGEGFDTEKWRRGHDSLQLV